MTSNASAPPKQPDDSLDDVLAFITTLPPLAASPRADSALVDEEGLLAQSELLLRILDDAAAPDDSRQHSAQPYNADAYPSPASHSGNACTDAGSATR